MTSESRITIINKTVVRPLTKSSATIHALLGYLSEQGFTHGPRVVRVEQENEVLSLVEGDTYNYPLKGPIATIAALESAAKMQRALHDATVGFLETVKSPDWMLEPKEPQQVICHGDYTPYNVALTGDRVSGVYDFDTAHPGPRLWDLAWSIYCWAPFKTHSYDALGTLEEQISRAKLYCDAYGLSFIEREALVDAMVARLDAMVDYMVIQAESGNEQFAQNIKDGHHHAYIKDIQYLRDNQFAIQAGINSGDRGV
ncbi:phosphotransferase enzyme family protein [Vibrio sonorensis]|uniref:phosphotransferase enzyme family protein n=1 Tax=Vibrio sonorensis TaxID=1004316 RepID=UPI0008D9CB72|nr:aminoglycoside phosphotransferase family protein [Vibrio sonorensis]